MATFLAIIDDWPAIRTMRRQPGGSLQRHEEALAHTIDTIYKII